MGHSDESVARMVVNAYRLGVRHALEDSVITEHTHVNPDLAITSSVVLMEMDHGKA